QIFYDEALEEIFPEAYMDAVQQSDLHPVSRPEVDVQKMEKGEDVEFSCEVYVQPEVKLGDYRGVEVKRVTRTVTDEEVDARIAQEQKRVARSIEVTDRAVENGDDVNLDYSGSVDGVLFEGGTAQGQHLVIGSHSFIPGFEEQMVGLTIGEEKDLNVKFPDEYHAEELKGKDAVFHVKVNSITREELPALDDDFASEVSDFDTFDAYREDLRKKMQETADAQSTEAAKQSLVNAVVEKAEVDIPDPMVDEKLDEMMQQMDWRMQQQGFNLKKYAELTGQSEDQMREMYRGEALTNVKSELVLDEIVKTENVEEDEKDVDSMLTEYASAMNQTLDQLKDSLNESQKAYFAHRSKVNKVLDMLWDTAKVTDEAYQPKKEETEEKPENDAPEA
ncbi:MAG: trigger factor, partial [Eubacteriales bacterium]|nr:trigger factor [Eubacteriales bacterium]